MSVRVEVNRDGAGGPVRLVLTLRVAIVDREYLVHHLGELWSREVCDRVGHEGGSPPFHRVSQAPRPPFAHLLGGTLEEGPFERLAGGRRLGVSHARLEAPRLAGGSPRTAAPAPFASLLHEPVLGQGLEVPRHVPGALTE